MKNGDGAYIQAYDAQAVVDEAHHVITAATIASNPHSSPRRDSFAHGSATLRVP